MSHEADDPDAILDCGHRPCAICDDHRFCQRCGADVLGNDPHAPGCPEDTDA